MKVLVNPADICAVPCVNTEYGKMRTCAYYPVSIVEYNEIGDIIDEDIEDGYEDDFINKICYDGPINNIDNDHYTVPVPNINELDKDKIYKNLKTLAASVRK